MTTCTHCNDTHRIHIQETGQTWPCTACPVPCESCRIQYGAYCKSTPCACTCHIKKQGQKLSREDVAIWLERYAAHHDQKADGVDSASEANIYYGTRSILILAAQMVRDPNVRP